MTEADLAQWFQKVGRINDCRICSDMNACKRFAFVEFADKAGFEAGTQLLFRGYAHEYLLAFGGQ